MNFLTYGDQLDRRGRGRGRGHFGRIVAVVFVWAVFTLAAGLLLERIGGGL